METYVIMYDFTDDDGYTSYGIIETVTAETWIDLQEKYINLMRKDWHYSNIDIFAANRCLKLTFYICLLDS